jgi:hypothetical protein
MLNAMMSDTVLSGNIHLHQGVAAKNEDRDNQKEDGEGEDDKPQLPEIVNSTKLIEKLASNPPSKHLKVNKQAIINLISKIMKNGDKR